MPRSQDGPVLRDLLVNGEVRFALLPHGLDHPLRAVWSPWTRRHVFLVRSATFNPTTSPAGTNGDCANSRHHPYCAQLALDSWTLAQRMGGSELCLHKAPASSCAPRFQDAYPGEKRYPPASDLDSFAGGDTSPVVERALVSSLTGVDRVSYRQVRRAVVENYDAEQGSGLYRRACCLLHSCLVSPRAPNVLTSLVIPPVHVVARLLVACFRTTHHARIPRRAHVGSALDRWSRGV